MTSPNAAERYLRPRFAAPALKRSFPGEPPPTKVAEVYLPPLPIGSDLSATADSLPWLESESR